MLILKGFRRLSQNGYFRASTNLRRELRIGEYAVEEGLAL